MRLLAPLVLLVLIGTACQSAPSQSSAPDILIASDLPASCPDISVQQEQAIQLAINEQDHVGRFKLGYLPFDDCLGDAPSQAKGVQNVNQMIANARVLGMIGPWTSNMAYAEIPVANPSDLVMLSPANTNECITGPYPYCGVGKPPWKYQSHPNNYFRIAAPEPVQGRAMARYISESLGVKRVAVFDESEDVGSLFIKEFGDELARAGGKLVFSQNLPAGTTSFKSFLNHAKAAGAQAIYAVTDFDGHVCAARAQMAGIFPKDAYFMGSDGMVSWSGLTSEAAKDDECIKDAVGNADGMLTATSDIDLTGNKDAASMKAVAAFRQAFPTTTDIASYMFATYDSARILIDAISRAVQANGGGIPTRAQVVDAVARAHFAGVTGTYSFDAHGDALSPMMSIYRVENGHWVLLKAIDARAKQS
jgi:branched-chain amino acid transport system substrate-binding protein